MDFLMAAFERIISQYGYRYELCRNNNGTYTMNFYNLPSELDYKLLCLQYDKPALVSTDKDIHGSKIIALQPKKENICTPVRNDKCNILHIEFNEDDYAAKINKIEVCIRNYLSSKASNGFI